MANLQSLEIDAFPWVMTTLEGGLPAQIEDVAALAAGEFHVWPDSMAKQIGAVYQPFAQNVIEADLSEG